MNHPSKQRRADAQSPSVLIFGAGYYYKGTIRPAGYYKGTIRVVGAAAEDRGSSFSPSPAGIAFKRWVSDRGMQSSCVGDPKAFAGFGTYVDSPSLRMGQLGTSCLSF